MNIRYLLVACAIFTSAIHADTLRIVDLSDLGVTGDSDSGSFSDSPWNGMGVLFPDVRGKEILEAYVSPELGTVTQGKLKVALRLKDAHPVDGFVDRFPTGYGKELKPLAFQFDPQKFPEKSEQDFAVIRKAHDLRLAGSGVPGAAWFRHRAGQQKAEQISREGELDSTFRMASGGRAISENLALDRDLILGNGVEGDPVEISSIKGITIPPIDWKSKLKPGEVKVDPLALLVPEDQHIAVLPSLDSLLKLESVLEKEGVPVLQSWDVRTPYRHLIDRYQAQMGISGLQEIAAALHTGSVAITGSDSYFATGTDLALILSTGNPDQATQALGLLLGLKAKLAGLELTEDTGIRGCQFVDRSFSVWFAKVDGAVVISNSRKQVQRILAVSRKEIPSLGSLEEYRFFRQRYALYGKEDGYVFLSDATLRRWCSPQVRIAASRRNRAFAALADQVASKIDGRVTSENYTSLLGEVTDDKGTLRSAIYNTLGFLSPIPELEITTATPAEAAAYNRWRGGYEEGWRKAFDPIALRLTLNDSTRGARPFRDAADRGKRIQGLDRLRG